MIENQSVAFTAALFSSIPLFKAFEGRGVVERYEFNVEGNFSPRSNASRKFPLRKSFSKP